MSTSSDFTKCDIDSTRNSICSEDTCTKDTTCDSSSTNTCSSTDTNSSTNTSSTCDNNSSTNTSSTCDSTSSTCDSTSSTCDSTSSTCDSTGSTCDSTSSTCDSTSSTCDLTSSTCDSTSSTCDSTGSTCDSTSSTCDSTSSTCDSSTCDTSSNTCSSTCNSSYDTSCSTDSCYTGSITSNYMPCHQNYPDVFVYDNHCIHTNVHRGICSSTPLVLGASDLSEVCHNGPVLAVKGDIYVSGQIYTGNQLSYCKHVHALEPKMKHGQLENVTYYHVEQHTGIIYVNPINGPIYIVLSEHKINQQITIKDVSLCYSEGSSHNVYVTVEAASIPNQQVNIETYGQDCKRKVVGPGTYTINTSNGSVTFRYYKPPYLGAHACWLIESEQIGNPRVQSLKFNMDKQPLKRLMK